ncbi:hypothetical protein DSO57_1027960 [Entomophthora muscae]|uniref:Uncharacterized protein n=1 Tax=Entomophthora muscae TaxID=34485 RepID=A0ACC2TCI2_9FUNG|nr:hypothetical protein DSO57_1027960 [Entomophthora muscae]
MGLQALKTTRLRTPQTELQKEDGTTTNNQKEMEEVAVSFYSKLFSRDPTDDGAYAELEALAKPFLKKCSSQESNSLIRPVTGVRSSAP